MAKALKGVLGRGARLVDVVEPEPNSPFIHSGRPHHVVVEHKGLYWDAAGMHTASELLEFWEREARAKFQLEPHHAARAKDQNLKVRPYLQDSAHRAAERVVEGAKFVT